MARMNLPIAVLCCDCEYWDQRDVQAQKAQNEHLDKLFGNESEPVDLTVGKCLLAKHKKEGDLGTGFPGPMATADGSGYHAALWTRNTHGCIAGVARTLKQEGEATGEAQSNTDR